VKYSVSLLFTMNEIDVKKFDLRKKYKNQRLETDNKYKMKADDLILENIKKCSEFDNAETILIYKSTDIETNTDLIIKHCFCEGKKIALPRCGAKHSMNFYYYNDGEALEISRYGIAEPFQNESRIVTDFSKCVCVVPGLAFDRSGYRLGYGGGYYDRFLSVNNIISIGICYFRFIADMLPLDKYDKNVDFLVTEEFLEGYNG